MTVKAKSKRAREVLASNLHRLMAERNWTQMEMAAASGVSQKTVSMILRKEVAGTIDTIDALAKALGVDGWAMLMPNVESSLQRSQSLTAIVRGLERASVDDRETLANLLSKFSHK